MALVVLVNDPKIVQYKAGNLCMLVNEWFTALIVCWKYRLFFISQIENKDKTDFKLGQTERKFKVAGSSKCYNFDRPKSDNQK